MNNKIKNYVDVLFSDTPKSRKTQELKMEFMSDLNEKYEAFIAEGMSENQAYSSTIAGVGDIDEMFQGLFPDTELKAQIEKYRMRKARNMAIAVGLYILGGTLLIGLGALGQNVNSPIYGLLLLLVCAAVATGLIVYTVMSVPQDVEPYLASKNESDDFDSEGKPRSQAFKSVMGIYWTIVVFIYLGISMITGAWHLTWLIWIAAPAFENAIKLMYDSRRK